MKNSFLIKASLPCMLGAAVLFPTSPALYASETVSELQQRKKVSGIVKDGLGDPLPGVNVVVKGTTIGTITNQDGFYELEVPDNAVCVFSYIGFLDKSEAVGGRKSLNVVMTEDTQKLDEVVVVGYGVQSKKDITGSVAVVDTEALKAATGSSATQQLQGKAAGVYVGQTGSPGSATMVRIRGVNTVNDNGPLYVIDGVSTRNQNLSTINPNDIESMQVLKDASAAAIYGAQAANGVILITTRKGSTSGKVTLNYDGYVGLQRTAKSYDVLNSTDRLNLEWQAKKNAFSIRGINDLPQHAQFGKGENPIIPNLMTTTGANGSQTINPDDYDYINNAMVPFSDTDWWDEIDRTAWMQNHQLTLTGGSDKGQYLMSANYFDQDGTVIHSNYKRYQVRANTTYNIRKWLRMGENLTYAWTKDIGLTSEATESTLYSWTYRSSPFVPVHDIAGNFAGSKIAGTGNFQNPVAIATRDKDNYWTNTRVFGNLWAELEPINELTFRTNFGLDYRNNYSYYMSKKNYEFSETPGTNHFNESSGFNFRWVWTNTANYHFKIKEDHDLKVLVGTEAIKDNIGRSLSGRRYGYIFEENENTWTLDMGTNDATRTNNSSYNGEFALFGVFGRLDYAYLNKYLLTANIRRDGVSRFSQSNRYGTFPSVSAGWRISEESFLQDTREWLDDLKLRAGWGRTGNAEVPRNSNFAYEFSTDPRVTNYDLGGSNGSSYTGFRLQRFGNPDTKWEATEMVNVGLDASFLNGKFNFNVEWWYKKTTDMLVSAAYSALAGEADRPYINYGNIENKGVDFTFNYLDKRGDWTWNVGLNLAHYKNKVLSLSEADDFSFWGDVYRLASSATRTTKGHAISEFYGYKIIGFYESVEDVKNSPLPYGVSDAKNFKPETYVGKYKFENANGDDKIDADDRVFLGSPHPKLLAGLNANLEYKNFDFMMFWYASIGNKLFNNTKYFTDFWLFEGNRSSRVRDLSWEPGKENAILPILDYQDGISGTQPSSYYVEDGSFLKLKNIQLGYSIPLPILKKWTIERLRVYLQAENLLTFTKYHCCPLKIS